MAVLYGRGLFYHGYETLRELLVAICFKLVEGLRAGHGGLV